MHLDDFPKTRIALDVRDPDIGCGLDVYVEGRIGGCWAIHKMYNRDAWQITHVNSGIGLLGGLFMGVQESDAWLIFLGLQELAFASYSELEASASAVKKVIKRVLDGSDVYQKHLDRLAADDALEAGW